MKLIKILLNPRVASAVVSAVSAVICACLAGCKLCLGSLEIKNLEADIFNEYFNNNTNLLEVL